MTTNQPSKTSRLPENKAVWQSMAIYNKAKSKWSFDKQNRFYGKMLEALGYNALDYIYSGEQLNLPISTTHELEQLIRDPLVSRTKMQFLESASGNNLPCNDYLTEYITTAVAVIDTPVQEESKIIELELVPEDYDNSIFDARPRSQLAELHPKQKLAAYEIARKIHKGYHGLMLIAGTGLGKTYVAGSVIKNLHHFKFFENRSRSPWPVLYVTKASIVEQTKRVLRDEFGLDPSRNFHVLNIEQLRSELGGIYLKEMTLIDQGEPRIEWMWKPIIHPCLFIWDECQILKNETSEQAKIGQASTKISHPHIYHLFMSATPFTRVCEGRVFACATRKQINLGGVYTNLSEANWHQYAALIAAPADPYEYSPAAVDRFRSDMDDYIITMKNVRPKYKARNAILKIKFETEAEWKQYNTAYERFLAKKAKIEGLDCLNKAQTRFAILAQMNKFREEAELIRAPWLAKRFVEVWDSGKAPAAAVAFKRTINSMTWHLINDHGWSRSDISIIWGGNVNTKNKRKDTARSVMANDVLLNALKGAGITLEDLGLDFSETELAVKTKEEIEFEKIHDLGPQNPDKRQKEIDRYMKQRSKCCIFTFKSGGVGLSLHHKWPDTRPREGYLTPVYSAMELVQGLGRLPRLTSLSETFQFMVYYGGTIEDQVAAKVSQKLGCLSKVVRQRESWEDIIVGKYKDMLLKETDDTKLLNAPEDDDDEEITDVYTGEDDEDDNPDSKSK